MHYLYMYLATYVFEPILADGRYVAISNWLLVSFLFIALPCCNSYYNAYLIMLHLLTIQPVKLECHGNTTMISSSVNHFRFCGIVVMISICAIITGSLGCSLQKLFGSWLNVYFCCN